MTQIETSADFLNALADQGCTFGYPVIYGGDGWAMCENCVEKRKGLICDSIDTDTRDTDRVTWSKVYMEGGLYCEHCNENIGGDD